MAANWIAPGRAFHATHAEHVVPVAAVRVNPPVILVVDDNADLRDLVSVKLYQSGYDVKTATNGWDAMRAAESSHPDLVVLDIMMPGPSGLEVCRQLRANPQTTAIPIVLVTGLDTPALDALPDRVEVQAILRKPCHQGEIIDALKSVLQSRSKPIE